MKFNYLLSKYLLIVSGFLLITSYIWFRFLRNRVPRNIPFTLLVISFVLLLISLLTYCYLIYKLFKPSKSNPVFQELFEVLFTPLKEFDSFMKQQVFLDDFFLYFYLKITNQYWFYFLTNILPRIITASALILDVFFLNQFFYIYKVIVISAVPLVARYFIYSLNEIKQEEIKQYSKEILPISTPYVFGIYSEIDEDNEIETFTGLMSLSLDKFITYQTNEILFNKESVIYDVYRPEEIYNQYLVKFGISKLTTRHYAQIRREAKEQINKILQLSLFIAKYKQACYLHDSLRNLKALLFFVYISSWSYILFLSFNQVKWITGLISLLHSLIGIEDPFSGCSMFYDLVSYVIENQDRFIIDIIPQEAINKAIKD